MSGVFSLAPLGIPGPPQACEQGPVPVCILGPSPSPGRQRKHDDLELPWAGRARMTREPGAWPGASHQPPVPSFVHLNSWLVSCFYGDLSNIIANATEGDT